jgi:hypothetical protein
MKQNPQDPAIALYRQPDEFSRSLSIRLTYEIEIVGGCVCVCVCV